MLVLWWKHIRIGCIDRADINGILLRIQAYRHACKSRVGHELIGQVVQALAKNGVGLGRADDVDGIDIETYCNNRSHDYDDGLRLSFVPAGYAVHAVAEPFFD